MSSLKYGPRVVAPATTYEGAVHRIRNQLRPYSAASIIDRSLESLSHWQGKGVEELKSAPWLTLLIVKLALENDGIDLYKGQECPMTILDELRDLLWTTPDVSTGSSEPSVYLMIRSLVHTQLLLQQRASFAFIRWPAMIGALPQSHESQKHFDAIFGFSPQEFIGMAFASYAAVLQGNTFVPSDYFEPLRPIYGMAIDGFLARFAKTAEELRTELRQDLHSRVYETRNGRQRLRATAVARPQSERIEFPWLSRYPLLRHRSGHFAAWHPLVFARGMEDAVHTALASLGQTYTDSFSKVFEGYVVDLIRESGLAFVDERAFEAAGNRSMPSVEAIVGFDTANVFVEAKMSLFPDQVILSDRAPQVFMKLKRVREAMVQGWKVGELLRNGSVNLGNHSAVAEDFLLIVTSRQLNLCSGEHLKRMFGDDLYTCINPESSFLAPSEDQRRRLPPQNIFILSIEEFEHLTGAIREDGLQLVPLLRQAAEESSDPRRSSFHFDQILSKRVSRWRSSRLIESARNQAETRLRQLLPNGM